MKHIPHPKSTAGWVLCIIFSPLILAAALVAGVIFLVGSIITCCIPCAVGAVVVFDDNNKNKTKTLDLPIELENLKNEIGDKIDKDKIINLYEKMAALDDKEGVTFKQMKEINHAAKDVKKDLKHNLTKEQYHQLFSKKVQNSIKQLQQQANEYEPVRHRA